MDEKNRLLEQAHLCRCIAETINEPSSAAALLRLAEEYEQKADAIGGALTILREYEEARTNLIGKSVVLSDGKAGKVRVKGHDPEQPNVSGAGNSELSAFAGTVCEARIAEARADGKHALALHVLHEGDLGEPLHNAVVVHDDGRVVFAYARDRFDEASWKIELTALPVAGQVVRALLDRPVALDDAGTCDADKGRQLESFLVRLRDQVFEHLDQALHRLFPARLVVRMPPEFGFPYARLGQVRRFLATRLDYATTDVRPADIDGENRVVPFEDPGGCKMQRADKTGVIRIVNDREHLDLEPFRLQDDFRACDGDFAEPAVAEVTANHDALGLLPWLGFRKRRVT